MTIRCHRRTLVALVALALLLTQSDCSSAGAYDKEISKAALLSSRTFNLVTKDRVLPHWTKDGNAFWYRSKIAIDGWEYRWVDTQTGTNELAFDHLRLAKALSKASGRSLNAKRITLDHLELLPEVIILDFESKRFKIERQSYALTVLPDNASPPSQPIRRNSPRASVVTSLETFIAFVNQSSTAIAIQSVGAIGEQQMLASVEPGEELVINMLSGSIVTATNDAGAIVGIYEAVPDGGEVFFAKETGRSTTQPSTPTPSQSLPSAYELTSPDGKYTAMIARHNITLRTTGQDNTAPLTVDGTADDGFEIDSSGLQWSPDSKKLIALRVQRNSSNLRYLVQSSPPDQIQPRLITYEDSRPGEVLPTVSVCLFDVAAGVQRSIPFTRYGLDSEIRNISWDLASEFASFVEMQRGCAGARLVKVDVHSGTGHTVVEESSQTNVNVSKIFWRFNDFDSNRDEVVWMSERDGWNHLYLVNSVSGEVAVQITKGHWNVMPWDERWDRVDWKNRTIWFRACGRTQDEDPYQIHHYRIGMDAQGICDLTPADGTHEVEFSPNGRFYIDRYSRVDLPPVSELRRTSGAKVCDLERADTDSLLHAGWTKPERFVAKGRDGTTDIYGVIYRPTNYDPKRKYPVVEDIHATPDDSWVPKTFSRMTIDSDLANLGFIVVRIDGMGTDNRGRAFQDVAWHNLGDSGFPDRVLWLRAAAAKYPSLDLSRAGIIGASAGGYNAVRALINFNEMYTVAISDSGVQDFRLISQPIEDWMGVTVNKTYVEQSNVANAEKIRGRLLLIVCELDRAVDPASSFQLVDKLIQLGKKVELVVIPNASHCEGGEYAERRKKEFLLRYLRDVRTSE